MMLLKDLIRGLKDISINGDTDIQVTGIGFDSRKITKGMVFVAIRGTQTDGHEFIEKAVMGGAAAIVVAADHQGAFSEGVVWIKAKDTAEVLAIMSANFYDHPADKLKLIGITGTNGKTTTATLLYQLFEGMGYKTGLISTVENRIGKVVIPSTHTTPDPVQLNALLDKMVKNDCFYVFMEVSSHAIDQKRITGLTYAGGVFTNITHDHLDYHGTFKAYIEAKKGFFDALPKTAFALVNIDDKRGEVMLQNCNARHYRYSLRSKTDFKIRIIENAIEGLQLEINGHTFFARMIGEFNAYNILAVYAVAMLLEMDEFEVLTVLSGLQGAEGRFDYILNKEKGVLGIIDYAHTPDALEKVLMTADRINKGRGRIITVVGCGGDRDRSKRPVMAKIACDYSGQVILTSDNPRSENPEMIIEEMEAGVPADAKRKVIAISDRKNAIRTACTIAKNGDVILVAGKGHEKYQEIKGVKYPFDDKEVLKAALIEI